MKLIVTFAPFLVIGCIMAGGCVAKTTIMNATVVPTVVPTFVPFPTNATSGLEGTLIVSINYPKTLAVVLDNKTVGTVNTTTPLFLRVPEGNHTVRICVGWMCEQENITTRFGRQVKVDFSERLQKNVEFPDPTARILEYNKNGNDISVTVEFLNPDTLDHTFSLKLSVGFEYIDDNHVKLGDSVHATTSQLVKAGQRVNQTVNLYLPSSGSIINFDNPQIEDLKVK